MFNKFCDTSNFCQKHLLTRYVSTVHIRTVDENMCALVIRFPIGQYTCIIFIYTTEYQKFLVFYQFIFVCCLNLCLELQAKKNQEISTLLTNHTNCTIHGVNLRKTILRTCTSVVHRIIVIHVFLYLQRCSRKLSIVKIGRFRHSSTFIEMTIHGMDVN